MSESEQLMAMGFSRDSVITALQMNNNNFDNALALLLNQASMVQQKTANPVVQSIKVDKPTTLTTNSMLESLSQGLSSDRPALDAVDRVLEKLKINPADQTVTVLQLGGFLAPIKSSEVAINFLKELGYSSRSGFLMLKSPPQNLDLARNLLAQAKGHEDYRVASALETSRVTALEDAKNQRKLLRQKPLKNEPDVSNTFTRLVFHFNEDGAPERKIERRFEPDDCLSDMIHYLGTLDEEILDAHSWELIENSNQSSPFWWCHGWEISDITLRPPRLLTKEDASKTFQGVGLWPSAQIRVKVSSLSPVPTKNNPSTTTARVQPQEQGHYLRSRPTPQQIMNQATSRFESVPLNRKEHANVNRSAASTRAAAAESRMKTTTTKTTANNTPNNTPNNNASAHSMESVVAELVAMGFLEDKVRGALSSVGGDQARAVEILLR